MAERSGATRAPRAPGTGRPGQLKVFITAREAICDDCGEELGSSGWITLDDKGRALCLQCADLDHLVFLPAGDAAVTRRAQAHSVLSAVVLRWSRARKRYERQGLLVEEAALEQAEAECLADAEARARHREREAQRRMQLDAEYVERFLARILEFFPTCPRNTAKRIAEHACTPSSGRVGRSSAGKALEEDAVRAAVVAHVRHVQTDYDTLLVRGYERYEARSRVAANIDRFLTGWQGSE